MAKASFFFGCSIAVVVLILIENFKHPIANTSLYVTQLFQLNSVIRLVFTQTIFLLGAAISIKVWKDNHVNYMYIFQLDYKSVIFFIQFFKTAFIYLFIGLLFLYIFLNDMTDLFQKSGRSYGNNDRPLSVKETDELTHLKKTAAIPLCCIFVLIWINPLDVL